MDEKKTIFDDCGVSEVVQNVQGMASNSASPSDTWILTLENKEKAFMKWYPSYKYAQDSKNVFQMAGLEYEALVYEKVTNPLIDKGICPFFVKCLGTSIDCEIKTFINTLKDKTPISDPDSVLETTLNFTQIVNNLHRSIRHMRYPIERSKPRPSINVLDGESDNKENVETYLRRMNRYRYGYIINELAGNGLMLGKLFVEEDDVVKDHTITVTGWSIIFQVCIACYALELSKISHNDLHTGNVFVIDVEPHVIEYKIDNMFFRFPIKRKVMLYDYDRSYTKRLGNNPLLERKVGISNRSNRFVKNIDILAFLVDLYHKIGAKYQDEDWTTIYPIKDEFLDMLLQKDEEYDSAKRLYSNFLFYDRALTIARNARGKIEPPDDNRPQQYTPIEDEEHSPENLQPITYVLKRIAEKANITDVLSDEYDSWPVKKYEMSKAMFKDGKLIG